MTRLVAAVVAVAVDMKIFCNSLAQSSTENSPQ